MYFSLPSIVLSGFVTIRPSRTLCLFRTGYLYFARQISITAGVCQVPADICSVVSPKAIPITNLFMVDSLVRARLAGRWHSESDLEAEVRDTAQTMRGQFMTWTHGRYWHSNFQYKKSRQSLLAVYSDRALVAVLQLQRDRLPREKRKPAAESHPPTHSTGGLDVHSKVFFSTRLFSSVISRVTFHV